MLDLGGTNLEGRRRSGNRSFDGGAGGGFFVRGGDKGKGRRSVGEV